MRKCALALLALCACHRSSPNSVLHVAAAADLARAFPEVGAAFEKRTGTKVVFSFGASGLLTKQIQEGGPFAVFAAANRSFVDDAVKTGSCDAASVKTYARGHLVIWMRAGATDAPRNITDLADARFRRIAIANPDHAPYGRAAKQALERAKLWDTVKPRVVFGENIQQTLQYAQSGNAEVALVSASLVLGIGGVQVEVDPQSYDPLEQAIALCGTGMKDPSAKAFQDFVLGEDGRATLRRWGFQLP
jgi:molybdate transport system substrate-binding protein